MRIACTAAQLAALLPFATERYGPPPVGYALPLGYRAGALYWPPEAAATGAGRDSARRDRAATREGSAVYSRDGRPVGTVHTLSCDSDSGALWHFVVREGVLFTHDVALPPSLIARIEDDVARLGIDAVTLRDEGTAEGWRAALQPARGVASS